VKNGRLEEWKIGELENWKIGKNGKLEYWAPIIPFPPKRDFGFHLNIPSFHHSIIN